MECLRNIVFVVSVLQITSIESLKWSIISKKTSGDGKVGDDVKRAIDENRAILKEEKKKRVELPDGH